MINTIVLIGLLVFCTAFIYFNLNMSSMADINNTLEIYCSQIASNVDYLEASDQSAEKWAASRSAFESVENSLKKNNSSYVVWNDEFNVVSEMTHDGIDNTQLKNIVKRYFREGHQDIWSVDYKYGDTYLRISSYVFADSEGQLRTVQVIKDMTDESGIFNNTVNVLIIMVIIGGIVSVLAGYFLSGHSLRPVREGMERQQEFLANASHELRTPIAVIRTNLDVIKEDEDKKISDEKDWIDNAYEETKRMQQIVEDLMFLARADAGEVHETNTAVDMAFLSQEVIERMLPVASKKGIFLDWEMPDKPLTVLGDEGMLTQLLVIFVDNAIKYSDSDTEIKIVGELREPHVIVQVIDQGIGIAPEDQKKIFNRFYRVDKARSREQGGTGLGLSIAQWIIEKHRGTVEVISEEGKGTIMKMTFPYYIQTNGEKENEGYTLQ